MDSRSRRPRDSTASFPHNFKVAPEVLSLRSVYVDPRYRPTSTVYSTPQSNNREPCLGRPTHIALVGKTHLSCMRTFLAFSFEIPVGPSRMKVCLKYARNKCATCHMSTAYNTRSTELLLLCRVAWYIISYVHTCGCRCFVRKTIQVILLFAFYFSFPLFETTVLSNVQCWQPTRRSRVKGAIPSRMNRAVRNVHIITPLRFRKWLNISLRKTNGSTQPEYLPGTRYQACSGEHTYICCCTRVQLHRCNCSHAPHPHNHTKHGRETTGRDTVLPYLLLVRANTRDCCASLNTSMYDTAAFQPRVFCHRTAVHAY